MRSKIKNPTVGDLIKLLQSVDPSLPFRIEDADTNWTISVIHYKKEEDIFWLYGDYQEMGNQ